MVILVFVVVAALWVAFGAALVVRPESLDSRWMGFRAAPLPVHVVEGVVLLPWVLGLAVSESTWAPWVGILLIAGPVWVSVHAFPSRRGGAEPTPKVAT